MVPEISAAPAILLLNLVCVFLIVRSHRFEWELKLRRNFGVDRHWWLPIIALFIGLIFSIVDVSSIQTAFIEKSDIIALIFSFGIMAEGLRASNFFQHLAYRLVERMDGDTAKLIGSMFILTSIATFFTSNDIVVYVFTPIIVSICFQAGINNTKLILLSQFVAANTLSIGMLIGSPTNIIVGEAVGLDFFSYLFLMLVPALFAFGISYLVLKTVIKLVKTDHIAFMPDLKFEEEYQIPEENPAQVFTDQMRDWILIFGFFVFLVAIVTYLNYSLFYCAIPAILISMTYWHFSNRHKSSLRKPLSNLPYGIFFFGMTFFIFAEQFSRTGFVNTELIPFLQNFFQASTSKTALASVFGSGIMVNMFLDLPSSAIISQILPLLELSTVKEIILTQGLLIGLNIGTYVTSIGALAGLIWFEEIRLQKRHESLNTEDMVFPERKDLIRYGTLNFVITGLAASVFLVIEAIVLMQAGF